MWIISTQLITCYHRYGIHLTGKRIVKRVAQYTKINENKSLLYLKTVGGLSEESEEKRRINNAMNMMFKIAERNIVNTANWLINVYKIA